MGDKDWCNVGRGLCLARECFAGVVLGVKGFNIVVLDLTFTEELGLSFLSLLCKVGIRI